ncbi:MAG: sporulation peptidase YabG [Clostridiales bacterium]|nr:sporulation peptidase YabG [Clostridiales bacterium]MCF8021548.1 sporulation peptidase YabG [Clostridiales bacterium]
MVEEIVAGDIVGRKSYGLDIYFKVIEVNGEHAKLKGLDLRLYATAPLNDLEKIDASRVRDYWKKIISENNENLKRIYKRRQKERQRLLTRIAERVEENSKLETFDVPGSVLHLDGDGEYLDICLTTYKQLEVPATGYKISEKEQPNKVVGLLRKHSPDLLVLTGHDGLIKKSTEYNKLSNYHNSSYFIEGIKAARRYEKSRDDLIIFAGACQSHYDAILNSGANFASSPKRVVIHAFDPVFIMEKIAYTSIYDPISLREIISSTITGFDGIGGLETRGKHRLGFPRSQVDGQE